MNDFFLGAHSFHVYGLKNGLQIIYPCFMNSYHWKSCRIGQASFAAAFSALEPHLTRKPRMIAPGG